MRLTSINWTGTYFKRGAYTFATGGGWETAGEPSEGNDEAVLSCVSKLPISGGVYLEMGFAVCKPM